MKTALIIGGGPAGLTAAYELLHETNIKPIVFEASDQVGGLSKTVNYKGNRIDIGGHRFFSKSDVVMQWWQKILPVQGAPSKDDLLLNEKYPETKITPILSKDGPDPNKTDRVMLIRQRISRILYLRKFFSYPVSMSIQTVQNLGLVRLFFILTSYFRIKLSPIKPEKSLEDFMINRFGKRLYLTFFKDYTEKVWGVPCNKIKPEWGAQRIKGLSITKTITHALKSAFKKDKTINQKKTETSLIENFMYPKLGPGQMWEEVAKIVLTKGGDILLNTKVVGIHTSGFRITAIEVSQNGKRSTIPGDYCFSTMPIIELFSYLGNVVPPEIIRISQGLQYRDFITVGLLLKKLKIKNNTEIRTLNNLVPDNWIYIQEKDVKIGRLQIFNNWSPYMVQNINNVWIGLEYFCNEGDELWSMSDKVFMEFAIKELEKIGIIDPADVLDSTIIRMPKTYPAYFGTYDQIDQLKDYINQYENLYLIGRNGMHRYNNQDHSMLTAITAVQNIKNNVKSKENIWSINTEEVYHETKNEKMKEKETIG
jgi:protoporphyrinogen oxidase